jgi:hypothetical protein
MGATACGAAGADAATPLAAGACAQAAKQPAITIPIAPARIISLWCPAPGACIQSDASCYVKVYGSENPRRERRFTKDFLRKID